MKRIDLNCDMGESFGVYKLGNDEDLLGVATSANIACGFHAGDPSTMRKTVKHAIDKGVGVGAHPGLPDLAGFGRRNLDVTPEEVYDFVLYQIGALDAIVRAQGGKLSHVKPHGALYNMAAKNAPLARAISEAVARFNHELILYGLSGSELIREGKKAGLQTASEVFADRTYQEDGSLTPRSHPDALIPTAQKALDQVIQMVTTGKVNTLTGTTCQIAADTICLHGDNPEAVEFARTIRRGLEDAGITVGKITAV